jgi:hypothetical protein
VGPGGGLGGGGFGWVTTCVYMAVPHVRQNIHAVAGRSCMWLYTSDTATCARWLGALDLADGS